MTVERAGRLDQVDVVEDEDARPSCTLGPLG